MFTLGEKERILNADADVKVFTNVNAEVTTSAAVALTDEIRITGFGKFAIADITNIKLYRAQAAVNESKDFTLAAPAGISVGEALEVSVRIKTDRYQSELKNNFIGGGRPIIFTTAALTGVSAANLRDAVVTAWGVFTSQFHTSAHTISVL